MQYKLRKKERETIIRFDEAGETAIVYTCNTQIKKRLNELSLKCPDIYRENEDEYSQTYTIPKKIIRFSLSRELSEKEKQKRAINLKQNIIEYKSNKSEVI